MINPPHKLKKIVRHADPADGEDYYYIDTVNGWLFTGCHDAHGKEIYEGDVLNDDGDTSVVTFKDGAFWAFDQILEHFNDTAEIVGHVAMEESK